MFEQAIAELENMGVPYTENEDGSLSIDISNADKTDVVTIVAFLNDNGMSYSIDASNIQVDSMGEELAEPEAPEDLGMPAGDINEMF